MRCSISVGAAIAKNTIDNRVFAYIKDVGDAAAVGATTVEVSARSEAKIDTKAIAASISLSGACFCIAPWTIAARAGSNAPATS